MRVACVCQTFLILVSVAVNGLWGADEAEPAPLPHQWTIQAPPADWNLSPFYRKCILLGDFPILSSADVHDAALQEAAFVVSRMLTHRPDVLAELARARVRLAVMSRRERTLDIPEHSDLTPASYWNRRARGLGATSIRPAVSCGEENLLEYPGDPYRTESILVHEFAHAIDLMALRSLSPEFQQELLRIFESAREAGLWEGKYAAKNPEEYWAEGVQSYFDTNRENDHDHNHVNTRHELAEYDPRLFALIDREFRGVSWRYLKPSARPAADRQHLTGFDPVTAPSFAWEPVPALPVPTDQ